MPGQACTGRLGPHFSRTHRRLLELQDLYHKGDRLYPDRDLPPGCWYNIFRHLDAPEIARAATVNRNCRTAAYDNRLWRPHFKKMWSPEYCGTLRTKLDAKDFHSLYVGWQTGRPATSEIITGVHGPRMLAGELSRTHHTCVNAVQLSQAGALAAWSVGGDGALVATDVTTCRLLHRFLPPHTTTSADFLEALTVLDSKGLVFAAGSHITGWDPRQNGNGTSPSPAFCVKYEEGTKSHHVNTMISAGLAECNGPSQLLTDFSILRNLDGGPVRRYTASTLGENVGSLAREPRHGTLLGGGMGGITCWDWETGAELLTLRTGDQHAVKSLAVGRDRLVSGGGDSKVSKVCVWAIPDPQAVVKKPRFRELNLGDIYSEPKCWQGVGEGPERILGAIRGSISVWDCRENPLELPICWGDNIFGVDVKCIAATDQVVVNGSENGAMLVIRVDAHFGM